MNGGSLTSKMPRLFLRSQHQALAYFRGLKPRETHRVDARGREQRFIIRDNPEADRGELVLVLRVRRALQARHLVWVRSIRLSLSHVFAVM